jgi:hypothetical protein
MISCVA